MSASLSALHPLVPPTDGGGGGLNPQPMPAGPVGCALTRTCSGSDLITGNYKDYTRGSAREKETEIKTEKSIHALYAMHQQNETQLYFTVYMLLMPGRQRCAAVDSCN